MTRRNLALIALLLCSPAFASTKDDLNTTRAAIDASRDRQSAIAEQSEKLDRELSELQQKLVEAAAAVQKSETALSASEEKLRILNDQLVEKNAALAAHKEKLAGLIQAALRLSRIPPEAMVMMPGDTGQTMKAAQALEMATDSIKQETASFGQQLAELQALKDKVEEHHQALVAQQAGLEKDRKSLKAQVAQRKALLAKLGGEQQVEEEKLKSLVKKANTLQSLMSTVYQSKERRDGTELLADERAPTGVRGRLRSFEDAKGRIRPPVAGRVMEQFGDAENRNATSKGISIRSRSRAQVTAPYDGEVLFAGAFLAYGKLVILRHSDDFHTLLAGLSQIDVKTGQFLLEGEPIGAMGDSKSANRLYVELRKKNQPVDPASWIRGFNH